MKFIATPAVIQAIVRKLEASKATLSTADFAELETLTKTVKAVKDSHKGKILLEGWEADLRELRE